ncbi:hypothetical protein DYD21_17390 [Rhodohalobacter sp. SW132]|nr:hypothetical protein DYD21_17390 [Rhodohalobacter sp. SW132]
MRLVIEQVVRKTFFRASELEELFSHKKLTFYYHEDTRTRRDHEVYSFYLQTIVILCAIVVSHQFFFKLNYLFDPKFSTF